MADWQLAFGALVARHWWAVGLAVFASLRAIWRLYRRTSYLRAALAREQQRGIERANEMQKLLLTAFFDAPLPTLQSLADDTETTFSLKPSRAY